MYKRIIMIILMIGNIGIIGGIKAEEIEEFEDEIETIEEIKIEENPFNSPDLNKLLEAKINEDVWTELKGELPCITTDNNCINQLQNLAVDNNFSVKSLGEKIMEVTEKIELARSNNKSSILWSQLSPFIQFYLNSDQAYSVVDKVENKPGPIERLLGDLSSPLRLINNILSLVGVPFLQNSFGGSAEVQERAIAIGDLEIKVAELTRSQTELKQRIRDQVVIELLALEDSIREYQISREIGIRDKQRLEITKIAYRFGEGSTESYLNQLNQFDRTSATVYRNWSKMRSQIVKLQQLVFDED